MVELNPMPWERAPGEPAPAQVLPEVPGRGDPVDILFRLPPDEAASIRLSCVIVGVVFGGVWYVPADDEWVAEFVPWSGIEGITANPKESPA